MNTSPSLALSMTDDIVRAGGVASTEITLRNTGSSRSTGIEVRVVIPEGWSAANDPADYTSLDPGETGRRSLELHVPGDAAGEYHLRGTATDDQGSRAEALANITVPDVDLELSMDGGSAPPGGAVSVTCTLTNAGSTPVEDVRISFGEPLNGWERTLTDAGGGIRRLHRHGDPRGHRGGPRLPERRRRGRRGIAVPVG